MGWLGSGRRGSAVLAIALASSTASALPAELSVDCPALSGGLRSSLEARARAELLMKQLDGRLSVKCAAGRAAVEFVPATGPAQRRDVSLTGQPKALVEEILSLVHEVTTLSETPSNAANTQQFLREGPRVDEAPPEAELPAPPPPGPPPPSCPQRRLPLARAAPAPIPAPAVPLALEPGIGVCAELWTNEPLALLGPCVSFGFRWASAWRVAPTLAVAWGSAQPTSIAVRSLRGGVEVSFGERLWLGVAAHVSWLHFAPGAELAPSSQDAVEPELALRVGYSFVGSRQSLGAALGLRTYPEYRDVRVDGGTAFRVPAIAITASLEYRFGLGD